MLPALCLRSPNTTPAPGIGKESHTNPKHFGVNYAFQVPIATKYRYVITKAAKDNQSTNRNTKPNSVICADCDGNGNCHLSFVGSKCKVFFLVPSSILQTLLDKLKLYLEVLHFQCTNIKAM
ncbi:hypothetical protein D0Y65_013962 [Glycine soja]|uniref:Uncharacterized protein n=1 Tax=Glycine soja TaxID=3848 RepID=A0A445K5U0_GLYSO|nr:hypothetical protein D0Y65_013962 [Glycine soja]RZC06166.1 hypothetical protein D0Y65_013962 [Glycine soja]